MDLKVIDTAFDPNVSREEVFYKRGQKKTQYKVWVYLEGHDLAYVEKVIYVLHPSFRRRNFQIRRRYANQNCVLPFWTWGIFTVKVKVHFKSGKIVVLNHRLTYGRDLRKRGVPLTRMD